MNAKNKQPKEKPTKNEQAGHKLASVEKLPDSAFVREAQLVSTAKTIGMLPFSSATLWRYVRENKFPRPFKLSERVTAWRLGDVRQWLNERSAAQPAAH